MKLITQKTTPDFRGQITGFVMNGEKKETCLVLTNGKLFPRIREQLADHFTLQHATSVEKAISFIRKEKVLCLIAKADDKSEYSPLQLSVFTRQFPTVPVITVVAGKNFDLLLSCAKMDAAGIMADTELDRLAGKIFLILNRKKLRGGGAN